VGKLVDWAFEQPWGSKTAVVISADHGESFGDHNLYKHGYELWEDVIHVPLLIFAPGSAARRIDTPRSHIDLAPTILELMGLSPELPLPGVSLVPELYGLTPEPRPVVADLPRDNLQDRRRAVIDGNLKLIAQGDDAVFQLYELESDPEELNDVFLARPKEARHMLKLYDQISASIGQTEIIGYADLKGAPAGRRW
jgi:arylsulfatase A-like enzyme